jgi:glycine C-acetyltransferase
MSSVRFICGTQDIHKELERKISQFLGTEDTILYSSCFDANGGLFEALLGEKDVVISDSLNHASLIDGIRLCKAARKVYSHRDMEELEEQLKSSSDFRIKMIATDGVFSMDGDFAPLNVICELSEKYDAVVMVDDSHATGFIGKNGRGTPEYFDVGDKVDIITSTLGKALGGASGGFTSGRKYVIEYLRQRSRPYLFSNSVAPPIVYASLKAIDLLRQSELLRKALAENTRFFRDQMKTLGFSIVESNHPIVPIMLGDAKLAQDMARDLLGEGIYVIGFSYPVVPKGKARIRVQISAAHTKEQLTQAIQALAKVGRRHGVIH